MAAKEQVTASAAGKYVMCGHCGGGWYWWRKIVLSSGTASFFDVEVFSPEAIVLSCSGCGKIQLFESGPLELRNQQQQQQQQG